MSEYGRVPDTLSSGRSERIRPEVGEYGLQVSEYGQSVVAEYAHLLQN